MSTGIHRIKAAKFCWDYSVSSIIFEDIPDKSRKALRLLSGLLHVRLQPGEAAWIF
jgi:hypothetical protein